MKTFVSFLLGILVGVAAYWYLTKSEFSRSMMAQAREQASNSNVNETAKDTFDADTIKDELARTGRVIREKAQRTGEVISAATTDARITSTIKAKLLQESALTALKIDVDTADGVVTLSGTVSSHEQISKAMSLAIDTEGVTKVISVLQLKSADTQPTPPETQSK